MPGAKTPARIDLAPGDAAIVVREDGEMEMFIPKGKEDEPLPPGQVTLAFFGMAFHDERLHDLLARIVKDWRARAPKPSGDDRNVLRMGSPPQPGQTEITPAMVEAVRQRIKDAGGSLTIWAILNSDELGLCICGIGLNRVDAEHLSARGQPGGWRMVMPYQVVLKDDLPAIVNPHATFTINDVVEMLCEIPPGGTVSKLVWLARAEAPRPSDHPRNFLRMGSPKLPGQTEITPAMVEAVRQRIKDAGGSLGIWTVLHEEHDDSSTRFVDFGIYICGIGLNSVDAERLAALGPPGEFSKWVVKPYGVELKDDLPAIMDPYDSSVAASSAFTINDVVEMLCEIPPGETTSKLRTGSGRRRGGPLLSLP